MFFKSIFIDIITASPLIDKITAKSLFFANRLILQLSNFDSYFVYT